MNKFNRFTLQLLCIPLLFLLMPMTATSHPSVYLEGISIATGEDDDDLLPSQIGEFRYSRTNPLGIGNLNYFWRVGSQLNISVYYEENESGGSLNSTIGFHGGGGLSYDLLRRSRLTVGPYFGFFYSNNRLDSGIRLNYFTTELGLEIDIYSKVSLIGKYTRSLDTDIKTNTYSIGVSIH